MKRAIMGMRWKTSLFVLVTTVISLLCVGCGSVRLDVPRDSEVEKAVNDTVNTQNNDETLENVQIDVSKPAVPLVTPTTMPTPTPWPTPTPIPITQIYYIDLVDDILAHNGEFVELVVPIDKVYRDNEIRVEEGLEYCINIIVSSKLTEKEQQHKFIRVRGNVDATESGNKWDRYNVKDCFVLGFYDEAPDDYLEQMEEYKLRKKESRIKAREDFITIASSDVSYEKLRKYPDTYTDKELKIKVKVTKVEAGSWLSKGSIYADFDGKEIVIHDDREVKEPRLVEGDKLTIYVKGDGLAKIQSVYEDSSFWGIVLGTDVVDSREIPKVKLYYTEDDNLDLF